MRERALEFPAVARNEQIATRQWSDRLRTALYTRRVITHGLDRLAPSFAAIPHVIQNSYVCDQAGINTADSSLATMSDREAKVRAVKILAKSIYRDLEAQGFDEKQIVSLATELISEVTSKMSARGSAPELKSQQLA
jgi:dipeptidase